MKILMIANFVTFPWEGGNSRFTYILDKVDYSINKVELITSNFRHSTKKHRNADEINKKDLKYNLTLINEPGYKKNVSIRRFLSHYILSKNLRKYLKNIQDKPDVIYCAIPSLDVAKVAIDYAKKNNIRFIIDIQDLWPESFKMAFNVPIISDILFYPMRKRADYIYANADDIIAVSETYVERALLVNKKNKQGTSVFLGTDLRYFDKYAHNKIQFKDDLIRIVYIGTLGSSYDIKSVIDAISILNQKGIGNIKFIIMGDGPFKNEFENYAAKNNINCEFTGRLEYEEMVKVLVSCDIAVNPIVDTSVASIVNKVGDYAAAGLPVINTQNSKEYRSLLEEFNAGINCENGNIEDISFNIYKLIKDKKLRETLGNRNRLLAEKKFNRDKTYEKIIKKVEEN